MYWFQGSVNLFTIHRQKHHKLHSVHLYMQVQYEIFSHFQTYAFPSLISLPLIFLVNKLIGFEITNSVYRESETKVERILANT